MYEHNKNNVNIFENIQQQLFYKNTFNTHQMFQGLLSKPDDVIAKLQMNWPMRTLASDRKTGNLRYLWGSPFN